MSKLWAITAYFNPQGYRSRRSNYVRFRSVLRVPLITVELAFDASFELEAADAEVLIQRRGGDVMWQKERLLNIALARLPAECEAVAWLDCDVLFSRPDWPDAALRALERWPLIQPFSAARDLLAPDSDAAGEPAPCFAATHRRGDPESMAFAYDPSGAPRRRLSAPGFAWAARRELLERTGLYDTCILGAGDRALIQAATGSFGPEIGFRMPSSAHAAHFRRWATAFHAEVGGRIGCIDGDLLHLWHGELSDRRYRVRFEQFGRHGFDPERDIALDDHACWRWASHKPALHALAADLFAARCEDGGKARA